MAKFLEATAVAPIVVSNVDTQKIVRIALTQENSSGKIHSSFLFSAKGENLNQFLHNTASKVQKILQLQSEISENGLKNSFGLTKGGIFELSITEATNEGGVKILNNLTFKANRYLNASVDDITKEFTLWTLLNE